jgi:F-type H+-transporting ATPase subunit b
MYTLLALAAEEAGHTGPASPFEVNFGLFFWTWLVFLTLMFVLWKFAFPAILRATEERERTIAKQLDEATRANTEAQTLLESNRKLLADARHQAQSILAEAKQAIEKERTTATEKTRQEQDALLTRSRREIEAEKEKALSELRREAVDLSLAAAARLVGRRMDSSDDKALVEEYLKSLEKAK